MPRNYFQCRRTPDGGCVLFFDLPNDVAANRDLALLKLNGSGDIEWKKTYDISSSDSIETVAPAGDGGYIIFGMINLAKNIVIIMLTQGKFLLDFILR